MGKIKVKYCQFCGAKVKNLSILSGTYHSNTCPEPSCPAYGDESYDEYEGLTIVGGEDD